MRQLAARNQYPPKTLPKLEVFIRSIAGVTVEEALDSVAQANRYGPDKLRIPSNKEVDDAINPRVLGWDLCDAMPLMSGTAFAYINPDTTFKDDTEKIRMFGYERFISCKYKDQPGRWLFPVPEEHLAISNGILIAEHPDLSIHRDGADRIMIAKSISLVEQFADRENPPEKSGWRLPSIYYYPDRDFGVPCGKEINVSKCRFHDIRFIKRIGKNMGLLCRDWEDSVNCREVFQTIFANYSPYAKLGMLAFREEDKYVIDGTTAYRSPKRLASEIEDDRQTGWIARLKEKLGF